MWNSILYFYLLPRPPSSPLQAPRTDRRAFLGTPLGLLSLWHLVLLTSHLNLSRFSLKTSTSNSWLLISLWDVHWKGVKHLFILCYYKLNTFWLCTPFPTLMVFYLLTLYPFSSSDGVSWPSLGHLQSIIFKTHYTKPSNSALLWAWLMQREVEGIISTIKYLHGFSDTLPHLILRHKESTCSW